MWRISLWPYKITLFLHSPRDTCICVCIYFYTPIGYVSSVVHRRPFAFYCFNTITLLFFNFLSPMRSEESSRWFYDVLRITNRVLNSPPVVNAARLLLFDWSQIIRYDRNIAHNVYNKTDVCILCNSIACALLRGCNTNQSTGLYDSTWNFHWNCTLHILTY